jgi:hypothetical protein
MDFRVAIVVTAAIGCGLIIKALASSWQRARDIDAGAVSSSWLIEQRVDRDPGY